MSASVNDSFAKDSSIAFLRVIKEFASWSTNVWAKKNGGTRKKEQQICVKSIIKKLRNDLREIGDQMKKP